MAGVVMANEDALVPGRQAEEKAKAQVVVCPEHWRTGLSPLFVTQTREPAGSDTDVDGEGEDVWCACRALLDLDESSVPAIKPREGLALQREAMVR